MGRAWTLRAARTTLRFRRATETLCSFTCRSSWPRAAQAQDLSGGPRVQQTPKSFEQHSPKYVFRNIDNIPKKIQGSSIDAWHWKIQGSSIDAWHWSVAGEPPTGRLQTFGPTQTQDQRNMAQPFSAPSGYNFTRR